MGYFDAPNIQRKATAAPVTYANLGNGFTPGATPLANMAARPTAGIGGSATGGISMGSFNGPPPERNTTSDGTGSLNNNLFRSAGKAGSGFNEVRNSAWGNAHDAPAGPLAPGTDTIVPVANTPDTVAAPAPAPTPSVQAAAPTPERAHASYNDVNNANQQTANTTDMYASKQDQAQRAAPYNAGATGSQPWPTSAPPAQGGFYVPPTDPTRGIGNTVTGVDNTNYSFGNGQRSG